MSLITRLTYALPHRALSSAARALAYSDNPRLKAWLIDTVTRRFGVDLSEAAQSDPAHYPTFNASSPARSDPARAWPTRTRMRC